MSASYYLISEIALQTADEDYVMSAYKLLLTDKDCVMRGYEVKKGVKQINRCIAVCVPNDSFSFLGEGGFPKESRMRLSLNSSLTNPV